MKKSPSESTSCPLGMSNQENASSRSSTSGSKSHQQSKKQSTQLRHRASVACASCRDRRIRCVVPKGEHECNSCKRAGAECVIKNDDERRRPVSKAYISSLSARINLLEGMLLKKGVVPPPAQHPPKTRQEARQQSESVMGNDDRRADDEQEKQTPEKRKVETAIQLAPGEMPTPSDSANEDFITLHESDQAENEVLVSMDLPSFPSEPDFQAKTPVEPPAVRVLDPKQGDIIQRLLSTKGNLSFDQISGRLRFFGPTASSHVYAESPDKLDSREPAEQVRRAERIIRSLATETYEYLMGLFWEYYNEVLLVLDQDAFETDRNSQNPKFYSSFLHITILAMAYRFADKDRDDMTKISLGDRGSTLHREAKCMLDIELERPVGIPSIQALLILSDLECGIGRDNTGWMYAGMANRLAFDIGLHLDCSHDGLPERGVSIRHMVMRACVIFDKYWALFLDRPTSIKDSDIELDLLSKRLSSMLSTKTDGIPAPKSLTMEIYDQLVELMELAGRIVEIRNSGILNTHGDKANLLAASMSEETAYLQVVDLDRKLQNWYRRLPDHLTWKSANITTAPSGFFLLHQQYHASIILLQWPGAKYGEIAKDESSGKPQSPPDTAALNSPPLSSQHRMSATGYALGVGNPTSIIANRRTSLSRSVCTQQAVRVCRIFWQYRQRFDGRKMFVTGIQHAGTAAIALIAALAHEQSNESEWRSYLGYLEIISLAIDEMSEAYNPAERMDALLKAVIVQLKQDLNQPRTRINLFTQAASGGESSMRGIWAESIYSALPCRRENPDVDQPPLKKRARAAHSRRASEFARPPASFSVPQRNPPEMNHPGFSANAALFRGFGEPRTPFNLESLHESAVDMAAGDSDPLLVSPSTTGDWPTMTMAPEEHTSSSTQPNDFGLHISDWLSEPAGTGTRRPADEVGTKMQAPKVAAAAAGGMNWMGSESGLNALGSINFGGLMVNVEETSGYPKSDTVPVPRRKQELDFLSL